VCKIAIEMHELIPALFIVGFMVMGAFLAAQFLWEDVAPKTLGLAIKAGQCSDGTPQGFCSGEGKRCVQTGQDRECVVINRGIKCKNIPKSLELVDDPLCDEGDINA